MSVSATNPSSVLEPEYPDKNLTGDVPDDFSYGTSVATCSASVRLGFIRKVYGILAAQLALTTFICAMFMFVPPLRQFAIASAGLLTIVGFIGTLGTILALVVKKDEYPLNMQLLAAFTVCESLLVGSVCAQYAASGLSSLVLEALIVTLAIFGGITLYAFTSKKDFSFMGGALYACLLALIACSFINFIIGVTGNKSPALAFLISWGGSVLFSLYILYDSKYTQSLRRNLESFKYHSSCYRIVCFYMTDSNFLRLSCHHFLSIFLTFFVCFARFTSPFF